VRTKVPDDEKSLKLKARAQSIIEKNKDIMKRFRLMKKLVSQVGFWSAILSFVFGMGYIVAQFAQFAGIPAAPWHLITLMFPSFLLAFSFVILMISIHYYASDERKIWSHIGLAFAIMYATLNSAVYFLQMTVLLPLTLIGEADKVAFLIFDKPSFIYGLDALGYSLMSLATLFVAPVFVGGRLEQWTRRALIANGFLTFGLLLQQNFPIAFYVGALWIFTFPISTALLAVIFKRIGAQAT